jgi:hypothetical protein
MRWPEPLQEMPDFHFPRAPRREGPEATPAARQDEGVLPMEEVFDCYEQAQASTGTTENKTCAIRMHKFVSHAGEGGIFPYLERFEGLPALRKTLLLDALPDIGTRRVQLWLAGFMRRRADVSHHPDYEQTEDFEVSGAA